MSAAAVFTARGDGTLVPSPLARGPWDPEQMHGGAPAAILARAVERLEAPGPMLLARLTIEFLRAVPMAPLTVEAEIVRPGRRLQLAEATISAEGREVVRARAVRLRREAVDVPAHTLASPRLARPDTGVPIDLPPAETFALAAMDVRFVQGLFTEPGEGTAWFRLRVPLVAGEEATAAQRVCAAADFGNGVARELEFEEHLFINTDLTVHLSREPQGEWFALESRTEHGPEGTAMAWSTLHDAGGIVGLAAQSLYVAPR